MAKKTNAELQKDIDALAQRITELTAENQKLKADGTKSSSAGSPQAQATATALRPDAVLLFAKFLRHGVLVAFYEDGKHIFDQDEVKRVQL